MTGSSMIVQGESPIQEALDRNRNLMDPKKIIKIGTWASIQYNQDSP